MKKQEVERLKIIMDELEAEALAPIKHQNLSYSESLMFDYDDDYIGLELRFGIEGGSYQVEQHKVNRRTMELVT